MSDLVPQASSTNALSIPDDNMFLATPLQRRAKSAFWARVGQGNIQVHEDIDLATVSQFVRYKALPTWWSLPGFRSWFLNQYEFSQKMEYIAFLCQDRIIEILEDKTANPNAVVKIMQMVFEMSGKFPRRKAGEEKFLDEEISKMSSTQLEEYLKKTVKLVSLAKDDKKDLTTLPNSDRLSR